jgi:hypothetical protein
MPMPTTITRTKITPKAPNSPPSLQSMTPSVFGRHGSVGIIAMIVCMAEIMPDGRVSWRCGSLVSGGGDLSTGGAARLIFHRPPDQLGEG